MWAVYPVIGAYMSKTTGHKSGYRDMMAHISFLTCNFRTIVSKLFIQCQAGTNTIASQMSLYIK